MKKFLIFLVPVCLIALYFLFVRGYWFSKPVQSLFVPELEKRIVTDDASRQHLQEAMELLKKRKDKEALNIFSSVLANYPNDVDALWGKAEFLRRRRDFQESVALLEKALSIQPKHAQSLVSLAYIRYRYNKLEDAQKLIERVLTLPQADSYSMALAYIMLGTINSKRAGSGGLLSKVKYGTNIECFFLRAAELAPDAPEPHLALGSFYLLAPWIAGGSIEKALKELWTAVELAPDFATANARLAQAYKKKGDHEKYGFYMQRVYALDPENEVALEIANKARQEMPQ